MNIKFVHSGEAYYYNSITQGSESMVLKDEIHGRRELQSSLNLYANIWDNQIDKLAAKAEWVFEKVLQRDVSDFNLNMKLSLAEKKRNKHLKLISNNKLSEAFDLLEEACESNPMLFKQIILLKNRHFRLNQQIRNGTISHSDSTIEGNRIVQSLLELVESTP